jgi:hypothetical protein
MAGNLTEGVAYWNLVLANFSMFQDIVVIIIFFLKRTYYVQILWHNLKISLPCLVYKLLTQTTFVTTYIEIYIYDLLSCQVSNVYTSVVN